jgi:phasin
MTSQSINDFLPPEVRTFAEQSVQQAKRAFDELMAATQRTVSAFEGQTSSAQTNAREVQRKVIAYSERNVAASLEFAQKLLNAKDAEAVMALHANYVKGQMQALTEQVRDLAQYASSAAQKGTQSKI